MSTQRLLAISTSNMIKRLSGSLSSPSLFLQSCPMHETAVRGLLDDQAFRLRRWQTKEWSDSMYSKD